MSRFMTARHKKYLNQDPNATPTTTAALAASSTGTMDSLGETSTPDRAPRAGEAPGNVRQDSIESNNNFGYHSEEEEPEPSRISMSETFEPLSDLSMSSRDIRRR